MGHLWLKISALIGVLLSLIIELLNLFDILAVFRESAIFVDLATKVLVLIFLIFLIVIQRK